MATCTHLDQIRDVTPSTPQGCTECLRTGSSWVHLRECLSCGHIGCCDSSPNRHATAHYHESDHPGDAVLPAGRGLALVLRRRGHRLEDTVTELTRSILEDYSLIAVVGLSTNPSKAAHSVPAAMQAAGFRVIPVHPTAAEILGERAYPTLADIPEPVQVVNVFRPSAEAAGIAGQAVDIGARAVWLQLGLRSPQARTIAEDAGLRYVEDRCIAVERSRYGVEHPGASRPG